jgi:opacity protein-like surface antigen
MGDARGPSGHFTDGSMKKKMLVLGSSVLGLALCAAVAAEAADDVVVEGAPAETTVTETTTVETTAPAEVAAAPEEDKVKPRGFYAGGGIGGSFFTEPSKGSRIFWDPDENSDGIPDDDNGDGVADAFTVDDIDDTENFMWSVFFGYRLADWLGAEVGWTDLGGFKATDVNDPLDPTDPPHNNHTKIDVDGVEARLKVWHPLCVDWIQGIGGLGIFIFSSHPPKFCNGPDTGGCDKGPLPFDRKPPALDPRHDSGQAFTISAGLQFQVHENVLIRTEYQHFFEVLDQGVHLVTANVVFGFYDFFGQGKGGGGSMGGITIEE